MRRKVRIWRCDSGRWHWECTLCDPASEGSTKSWMTTCANVHRHCTRNLIHHHAYVARRDRTRGRS